MIRNYFFGSLTAFCLLALGACGGEKNSTDTNVAPSDGSTSETTDPGTESGTTGPGTTEVGETNSTVPGTTDGTTGPDDSTTAMAPTTTTASTTDEPSTTTADPSTTTVDPSTTTDEPSTTTDTGSTTDPVDPELQQCLQEVEQGDPCGVCACNECLTELQACSANPGCKAIRDCAQEAGCSGVDCIGPCGAVINMNGGVFGQPAQLAQAIGNCVDSQCASEC